MDADSSYGGSDTAQDSHSGHDNSSSLETTHNDVTTAVHDLDNQQQEPNNFYHKNEITLPVNYDEADFQENKSTKQPHYLSTANLNINDTLEHHSNLEEMSKNYKSTSYLNESPRIRKKSNEGVDNPAFQEEEYKPEVKSTFDNNKPYNGDLNSSAMLGLTSPNKNEEPLTEAVNLELINLKPVGKDVTGAYENGTNGMTSIPVKKENDAEIGNPYDEYFVPVNEHRKYMRGEKLYVTMDKRNKKKRNKCLCWGLCLCIVAAAVIIGILAAVGIIGNQGPHPIHEVSARNFNPDEPQIKAGGIFGLPKDVANETTTPETETSRFTPGPPVVTVPNMLPTTETSMIQVPRALESQFVIDNLQFSPALTDKNSTEYKQLAEELETALKNSLFSSDLLKYGAADIEVKVMDFASGSVVVKYRVTWVFKDGIHNAKDPINEEMLQNKLKNVVDSSNGFLTTYHVADNTISAEKILDLCKINNNDCEYNCSFNYQLADFVCSCPEGKQLSTDQKSCMDQHATEEAHVHFPESHWHHNMHEPVTEPEPSVGPETSYVHYPEHEHHSTPEPEPALVEDHEHDFGFHTTPKPEPESVHEDNEHHEHHTTPKPEPEPTSEPEPKHDHDHSQDDNHEHHHTTLKPESEPSFETVHDYYYHHEQHTTPKPEPEPSPEPEPEPVTEPRPIETYRHFEEVPPEPESTDKPEEMPRQNYVHLHEMEPTAEPKSEPTTEEQDKKHMVEIEENVHHHETGLIVPEPEPTAEPNAEPAPEPTTERFIHNTEIIATKEELTTKPNEGINSVHHLEHGAEVVPEPTSEPVTSTTSTAEDIENSVSHKHEHEVPAPELKAEPAPEPTAEPAPEPTAEPAPEPTSPPVTTNKSYQIPETTANPAEHILHQDNQHNAVEHNTEYVAHQESEQNTEPQATAEPSVHQTTKSAQISQILPLEHSTENIPQTTAENVIVTTTKLAETRSEENNVLVQGVSLETSHQTTTEPKPEAITEPITKSVESSAETNIRTTTEPRTVEHVTEQIFKTVESSSEAVTQPSPFNPVLTNSETTIETINEIHSSSTEAITTVSSVTSNITSDLSSTEFRHNHHDILVEPEVTTMVSHEVSSSENDKITTTTPKEETVVNTTQESQTASRIIEPEKPATTQAPAETTNHLSLENHEENLIPVSINEQPRLLYIHNVTESENQTTAIPLYVNDRPTVLQTHNESIVNVISPIEATTTPMPNNTHIHVTVVESTENTSAMDNMSPFLPEIDNDTFVNKLHLGEHVIPHVQNETHDDETSETSPPPRLDNDQMNVTNPQEVNVTDSSLQVVPLEGHENEVLDKTTIESKETHQIIPVLVQHEQTTQFPSNVTENQTEIINEVSKETEIHMVPVQEVVTTTVSTSMVPETKSNKTEETNTTLPPEALNNIHSTSDFDNKRTERKETENTEFSTSTEDLIALETTTNREKIPEAKFIVTTEAPKVNHTAATVHAEILDTVTEKVHFDVSSTEKESNLVLTNISSEQEVTTLPIAHDVTTLPTTDNVTHSYQVNEETEDVTTTEKLFITAKSTTENPTLAKAEYDDLSVVPLNSNEENETSKIRVAHDLEAETNNSVNDISEEDQIIKNRFLHNDIDHFSTHNADVTTIKIEADTTDFSHELTKDEIKASKKNYYDKEKSKFEKKVKLEKVITTVTDDELLTSAIPNDQQPHPFSDIRPVTEDFEVPDFSRCTYGQFHCVNGTSARDGSYCIPENDRCDSVDDCSDGSDEIDCVKNGCPNNFQCASGQCLKRHLVCDGIQNCNDGSDEIGCDHWKCRFDEVSCGPGSRCLPIPWKCDGKSQCPDGSDEHNCPSSHCNEDSFHCTEQNTCVPKSWKCDSESDCMNSEDEKSCECASDEFKCAIGGGCVKKEETCDGVPQCADQSDEWHCLQLEQELNNKKYLEVKASNSTWYPVCSDNWNQTHSNLVCHQLGYGGASSTESISKPDDFEKYFKLKLNLKYGMPILAQLEKADSCDSVISITCQEFACGSHSTLNVQSARIIGGNRSIETQWPSLTLLYNKRLNLHCTATLVTPIWVIASYSCVFDLRSRTPVLPSDWILYAGSTNFFSNSDNSTTQIGQVSRILPHPQAKFSQFEYKNDVVLVELARPLTMTRNVSALCLPDKDIEPRQLCVIAGWGVSKPGEASKNQYLHYLPVPITDSEECNSTKHYNGLMTNDKLCAGYTESEKTPCYNDEGAPLMCFSDSEGTWELQGVLSHHDNCARSKHPAIYTSMNERMRKWVINTIGQTPARSAS